jgi:dTDP-4-dehydrorhamnose 3,5-epimerase
MNNLQGVDVVTLLQIPDNRGTVKRFLRADDMENEFRECYLTTIYKNIIKGWHSYKSKTLYYCAPFGMVKLVLYDSRKDSDTYQDIQEIYLGDFNYCRVTIPPGIMNAFQGISDVSLIAVIADEVFDENLTIRLPIDTDRIPYDWTKINK